MAENITKTMLLVLIMSLYLVQFASAADDNTAPVVNIIEPLDGSVFHINQVEGLFKASDDFGVVTSCTLLLDNIPTVLYGSVTNDLETKFVIGGINDGV